MSTDINRQVLMKEHGSKYGYVIQMGILNCAQVLVFVHYATYDFIQSELLFSNE